MGGDRIVWVHETPAYSNHSTTPHRESGRRVAALQSTASIHPSLTTTPLSTTSATLSASPADLPGFDHDSLHRPSPSAQSLRSPATPWTGAYTSPSASSAVSDARPLKRPRYPSSPAYEPDEEIYDANGELLGIFSTLLGPKRPRTIKKTAAEKDKASRTRALGACARCRRLKKPCIRSHSEKYMPCDACLSSKPLRNDFPCVVAKLDDAQLVRLNAGNASTYHPFTYPERPDILARGPLEPRAVPLLVWVAQDFGFEVPKPVELEVARYAIKESDALAHTWYDSANRRRSVNMPFLGAMVDQSTREQIKDYATKVMCPVIKSQLNPDSWLVQETFRLAMASSSRYPLVGFALRIWSTTRLIENQWRFVGGDNFFEDLRAVDEESSPWHGITPVTPFIDQQLDQILIAEDVRPYREALIKRLGLMINERLRKDFFEVYLAIFVLSHNFARQLQHVRRLAKRYNWTGRYGNRGQRYNVEGRCFDSSRIVLAHFHDMYRGAIMFNKDWTRLNDDEVEQYTEDEIKYMRDLTKYIEKNKHTLKALKEGAQYEHDLYFAHQLFFDGWRPGDGHIKEMDERANL